MYDNLYVLQPFFSNPEKDFHIREVARILKLNPMTARKYLQDLAKEGLLTLVEAGVLHRYRANVANPLFHESKRYHNIRSVITSGLVDALRNHYSPPLIMLFGDYAEGNDTRETPIEIMVLTEDRTTPQLESYQKSLGRRLRILLFSRAQLTIELRNGRFANQLAQGRALHGRYLPFKVEQ